MGWGEGGGGGDDGTAWKCEGIKSRPVLPLTRGRG